MRKLTIACVAGASALFVVPMANADLVLGLDTVISSDTPFGTAPWLTATFSDVAGMPGTVRLTLQGNLQDPNEFIDGANPNSQGGWYFNLDPTMIPADLIFDFVAGASTGPAATGIEQKWNSVKADGDGFFDVRFRWDNASGHFTGMQTVVYDISGIAGLTEDSFNFLSVDNMGLANGFESAAHVQGITGPQGSGWIAVPAPGAALLGAIGLGFVARRRRCQVA